MRRILSFALTLIVVGSLFAQGGARQVTSSPKEEESPKKELVDIKADVVYPYKVNPDSSVLCLVGNFAAQHNGAVITADSAVRYGDDRIDCFGNVLINKNTTYAYADRAIYNGATNEVELFSPIIKVIDEGVTLYTYNFRFNTLDNVGVYWGGAVTTNQDSSRLESLRGYYYADSKHLVGVDEVEIFTDDYELKGDSVRYNMESDYVEFWDNTNIWNSNGEYLYADMGNYDKALARFSFTRDGYILTSEQEVWSDSLDYFKDREEAILRSNIQIDDTLNKTLIYSDFAHYWGDIEKVFLTKRPILVNYDPEQSDTMFMRADTIILTTHNTEAELRASLIADSLQRAAPKIDSLEVDATPKEETPKAETPRGDTLRENAPSDNTSESSMGRQQGGSMGGERGGGSQERGGGERGGGGGERGGGGREPRGQSSTDSSNSSPAPRQEPSSSSQSETTQREQPPREEMPKEASSRDSIQIPPPMMDSLMMDSLAMDSLMMDSLMVDSIAKDTIQLLGYKEVRAREKAEAQAQRAEEQRIKTLANIAYADSVSLERQNLRIEKLDAQKAREERDAAARREKLRAKMERRGNKAEVQRLDSIDRAIREKRLADSLDKVAADSLAALALEMDSLMVDSLDSVVVFEKDSIYRLVVAYRNVKTLQGVQQSVSDSMFMDFRDTTLHLYKNPYMWNGLNQISSDVMDIYTREGEVTHAVFTGSPIMSSKIDTTYYNQVAGKTITSIFKDGQLARNEVDGNVQTIYFAQDEDSGDVTTMVYVESGSATFYLVNQELEGIAYRSSPTYVFYPVAMIPLTQPMRLEGFEWKGTLRPQRRMFSDRIHRPSIRAEKEALPRPEFPIEYSLHLEIENLVRDRRWMDRTDLVAPDAEEWLESLGHKSGQPRSEPIK